MRHRSRPGGCSLALVDLHLMCAARRIHVVKASNRNRNGATHLTQRTNNEKKRSALTLRSTDNYMIVACKLANRTKPHSLVTVDRMLFAGYKSFLLSFTLTLISNDPLPHNQCQWLLRKPRTRNMSLANVFSPFCAYRYRHEAPRIVPS